MKYDKDSVIISDSLNGLGTDIYKEYLSHALCLGGACKFEFNGNPFELHEGDCITIFTENRNNCIYIRNCCYTGGDTSSQLCAQIKYK